MDEKQFEEELQSCIDNPSRIEFFKKLTMKKLINNVLAIIVRNYSELTLIERIILSRQARRASTPNGVELVYRWIKTIKCSNFIR